MARSPRTVEVAGGAVVGLNAKRGDPEAFVGLSSVTSPTHSYLLETSSAKASSLAGLVKPAADTFRSPGIVMERRTATSKDGTLVPYFLIAPIGVDLLPAATDPAVRVRGIQDPRAQLTIGPAGHAGWPPAGCWRSPTCEAVESSARPGTRRGRLAHKQNVFDDYVAVAEHLKETGVTTTRQLALHGRSNGGLLVGAVLTQHPDLAACGDCRRSVCWTCCAFISSPSAPHGSPTTGTRMIRSSSRHALAYSPLHNVRPGTALSRNLGPHWRS